MKKTRKKKMSQPFQPFRFDDEDNEEVPIFEDEESYLEEVRIGKMYIEAQQRLANKETTPKQYEDEIARLNALYDDDFKEDYEYTDDEIEEEYNDVMRSFQEGRITREEREEQLRELDERFGDMIAEKNGLNPKQHGTNETEQAEAQVEDQAEREYFENCDRLLDERFERDSDYC
jgi:hypothetical protein